MKTKILFLIAGFISLNAYSQVIFSKHVVETGVDNYPSVFSCDIDGDGDMDLVYAAAAPHNEILWSENLDGQGSFGLGLTISSLTLTPSSVHADDVDGDGDMDVLSTSLDDNKISWYDNTDGLGSFGSQQIITTQVDWPWQVYTADLDGDGDMDVLSASSTDSKIAWYENTDGQGNFGTQQVITTNAIGAVSVYATDIDGDGDTDVLSASASDNKIAWYENTDGHGIFGPQQIITTNAIAAGSVHSDDIDGDGDMDVLSASATDNKIAWYENTDGQGNFGPQQIITTNAIAAVSVYAADIDSDNDLDVLSASFQDGKIAWYENTDGQGSFGPQQIITTEAFQTREVLAQDIDGDIDLDVISCSGGELTWFENLIILDLDDYNENNFIVYPNPTTGILNIESNVTIVQIEIYNPLGQLVFSASESISIDISNLDQGIYYCRIKDEYGNTISKKILKN